MARLTCSSQLIAESLFGSHTNIRIIGASYDNTAGNVILSIDGIDVPDCEEVMCTVHKETTKYEFEEIK